MALDATSRGRLILDSAVLGVAILGLALVTRNDAGLAGAWVLVGLASALPLYLVARGWRLPWWMHAAAAALPLSVLVVSFAHGYGDGAARASRYAYGALLILAVAAWARTPARRLVVAVAGALLVADQYAVAFLPWWGFTAHDWLMSGTFYWHNPFAAYMVIGAALAAVLAVLGRRVVVLVGFVASMLAAAGVLASGSRAGLLMFGFVLVVALVIAVVGRGWQGSVRWLLLVALSAGMALFMSSPLLLGLNPPAPAAADAATEVLDDGSDPLDSFEARNIAAEDSFAIRLELWRTGIVLGAQNPVIGVGLQDYAVAARSEIRLEGWPTHPHSEYVLGWAEGGVIGAIPLLAVLIGSVWLVLRSVLVPLPGAERRHRRLPGRRELGDDPGRWAGLLALVPAVAHAGFDFDWIYPALVAMTGLVGGLAAAPLLDQEMERRSRPKRQAVLALLVVGVIVAAAVTGYMRDPFPTIPLKSTAPFGVHPI